LDKNNDVEVIGDKIALKNATNELWKTYGAITKLFIQALKQGK